MGADDATGRNNRQRSSYIAYDSRGVCGVATRANGFDEARGEVDGEDALDVQSMVPFVARADGGCVACCVLGEG